MGFRKKAPEEDVPSDRHYKEGFDKIRELDDQEIFDRYCALVRECREEGWCSPVELRDFKTYLKERGLEEIAGNVGYYLSGKK